MKANKKKIIKRPPSVKEYLNKIKQGEEIKQVKLLTIKQSQGDW
jgi:hypothetical protein